MRKISATTICLTALAAVPATAQDASQDPAGEPWLPSLMTETPAEGFDLAVSMARKAVTTTQTDIEALHALRHQLPVFENPAMRGKGTPERGEGAP